MRFYLLLIFMVMATHGEVAFEGEIYSEILKTNRMVRIYLPPSYGTAPEKRYPVLYFQDGQNAFSTAGPHAAFGWGSWELDRTADRLVSEARMREIIIVGIDCSAQRYREYRGPTAAGSPAYEAYAHFLRKELKPKIDREYRTLPTPAHTAVMGSSMGGICSLALAWEYPRTFGKAASISGSFQVEKQHFLREVLAKHSGRRKPLRIYLDSGKIDDSGDDGAAHTAAVARELERIGWKQGVNLLHFLDTPLSADDLRPFNLPADKFAEAQRSQHNEFYWRLRAWRALTFLFPPED